LDKQIFTPNKNTSINYNFSLTDSLDRFESNSFGLAFEFDNFPLLLIIWRKVALWVTVILFQIRQRIISMNTTLYHLTQEEIEKLTLQNITI